MGWQWLLETEKCDGNRHWKLKNPSETAPRNEMKASCCDRNYYSKISRRVDWSESNQSPHTVQEKRFKLTVAQVQRIY